MPKTLVLALSGLLLAGCPDPKFPDRATCRDLAIGLATAEANALCPISKGEWEACPHATRIEDDLAIGLEICDGAP